MAKRRYTYLDAVAQSERQRRQRIRSAGLWMIAAGITVAAGSAVAHQQYDVKPERARQQAFEANALALARTFAADASDPHTTICASSVGLGLKASYYGRPSEVLIAGKECSMDAATVVYKVSYDLPDGPDKIVTVYQHEGPIAPGHGWPRHFSLTRPAPVLPR